MLPNIFPDCFPGFLWGGWGPKLRKIPMGVAFCKSPKEVRSPLSRDFEPASALLAMKLPPRVASKVQNKKKHTKESYTKDFLFTKTEIPNIQKMLKIPRQMPKIQK
eukprot:2932784-Amphidinium_carterae.1